MQRVFVIILALLGFVTLSADNSKLSNRTKLLVKETRENLTANKVGVMSAVSENKTVAAFITVNDDYQEGLIEKYGGVVRNNYKSIGVMTVDIPVVAIEALSNEESIVAVEISSPVKIQMDKARPASNADKLMDGKSPLTQSYMASGVLLGIVDQEIQVNHINFYNPYDNTELRIKRFLNQNTRKEYKTQSEIEAAQYDVRSMSSGHATHVLGIAAGANRSVDLYGIAQFADLAVVSTTGGDADLSDGVKYIFDYADEVKKPCVVNISMGGVIGPHDGSETCNKVIESLIGPGRLVVGAAGNSGEMKVHVGKKLNGNDSIKTFIKMASSYGWYSYTVADIWGDTAQNYEVSFVVYSKSGDSIAYRTPFYKAMRDSSFTLYINTKVGGSTTSLTLQMATGRNQLNNRGNVYIEYQENDLPYNCYFGMIVRGEAGNVNLWTYENYSEFTDNNLSSKGWLDGDDEMTIGTGVGDTRNVITVGSYISNTSSWSGSKEGDISSFSSKGPLPTGQMKPEITAPGEIIVSSIPDLNSLSYSRSASTTVNGKTYYYGEMQGTSMSSPYCAGVVACWLEAKNDLSYDDVMDVFQHTAITDKYTGDVPNDIWGYGKLDAYNGLLYILENDTTPKKKDEQQVIGYISEGYVHIAGLTGDVDLRLLDMSGRVIYTKQYANISKGYAVRIDISNLQSGVYIVNANGNNIKFVKQ